MSLRDDDPKTWAQALEAVRRLVPMVKAKKIDQRFTGQALMVESALMMFNTRTGFTSFDRTDAISLVEAFISQTHNDRRLEIFREIDEDPRLTLEERQAIKERYAAQQNAV